MARMAIGLHTVYDPLKVWSPTAEVQPFGPLEAGGAMRR